MFFFAALIACASEVATHGVSGELMVGQTSVEFIEVSYLDDHAVELELTNTGPASITVNMSIDDSPELSVRPSFVTIAPGEMSFASVTFVPPGDLDERSAELLLESVGGESLLLPVVGNLNGDLDDDGYLAIELGGDDCDDLDSDVNPGAIEVDDGVDNDCDGFID